jgi:predicted aminopeptidase
MPHKFNEDRRHKIAKQKFKVTNWSAYNESLRRRGDLTVWVSDEALSQWSARRRTSRGGQPKYSDLAITMCLTLRVVYDLPLRQTQGLMGSIAKLMSVRLPCRISPPCRAGAKGWHCPQRGPEPEHRGQFIWWWTARA